jgi:hypothetical protein
LLVSSLCASKRFLEREWHDAKAAMPRNDIATRLGTQYAQAAAVAAIAVKAPKLQQWLDDYSDGIWLSRMSGSGANPRVHFHETSTACQF